MSILNIGNYYLDIDKSKKYGQNINDLASEADGISKKANGIDISTISSYSKSVSGIHEEMSSNLKKTMQGIEDFYTSYTKSVLAYEAMYEETKKRVKKLETGDILDEKEQGVRVEGTKTEPKKIIDTSDVDVTTTATIADVILSKDKQEELDATIDFYFRYPAEAKRVSEISSDKLGDMLKANGARLVGGSKYEMKIDGNTYTYDVVTQVITMDNCKDIDQQNTLRCKFLARDDVSFDEIKSTITLLAGSGQNETGYPLDYRNGYNVEVSKNSLVVIPYGKNTPNMPGKVAGCTRVGDFMVGGADKTITNSIAGFSLGGEAAYSAVANNPGLYDKMAVVNADHRIFSNGKEGSFKDVEIYLFETNSDDYRDKVIPTINAFKKAGVSSDKMHVYTNYAPLYNKALEKGVSAEKIDNTWRGHNTGYEILSSSGIFGYLTL